MAASEGKRASVPDRASADVVVLVIGMARSGSSATARVLSLCGGELPDELLPANRHNPTGFWEPSRAVEINARYLQAIGSSFYDTSLNQDHSRGAPIAQEVIAEIVDFLSNQRRNGSGRKPVIVKDPRISNLLPFWLTAADRAGFDVGVVMPIRAAGEVSSSLLRWKGLPTKHAAELWLKYNLEAERGTRHLPRAFVSYEQLLGDWRSQVQSIAKALQLPFQPNDAVDSFLSPSLRHAEAEPSQLEIDELASVREVEAELIRACHGLPPDFGRLDSIYAEIREAQADGRLTVISAFGKEYGVS